MQWSGEGLIIGVRRHGESSVIAEIMVEGRGRVLGLVRGGGDAGERTDLGERQVAVRERRQGDIGAMSLEQFKEMITQQKLSRSL